MRMSQLLYNCDERAAFMYQWKDFHPLGLLFYKDGNIEAISPTDAATVGDIITVLGRAAAAVAGNLTALGLMVSGWASPTHLANPKAAPDRQRFRATYAVDTDFRCHVYSNIADSRHYEIHDNPPSDIPARLLGTLQTVITSGVLLCSTGQHERTGLL